MGWQAVNRLVQGYRAEFSSRRPADLANGSVREEFLVG